MCEIQLGAIPSPLGRATSSPPTAPAAPAATQRICWRSIPREERNRSTTQTAAGGRLNQCSTTPTTVSTAATSPAVPASPSGLSIPSLLHRPRGQGAGEDHQDGAGHAGGHDQPPATRAQPAVGQQQGRQRDPEGDRGRPAQGPGRRDDLGDERQGPMLADELVEPGLHGNGVGPGEAGGPVQPADRVPRPPQRHHQPHGGEPEHEEERVDGALDQHADGEGPVHGQGDPPARRRSSRRSPATASRRAPPRSGAACPPRSRRVLAPPSGSGPGQSARPAVRERYGHRDGGAGLSHLPVTLGQHRNRFPED